MFSVFLSVHSWGVGGGAGPELEPGWYLSHGVPNLATRCPKVQVGGGGGPGPGWCLSHVVTHFATRCPRSRWGAGAVPVPCSYKFSRWGEGFLSAVVPDPPTRWQKFLGKNFSSKFYQQKFLGKKIIISK